MSNEINIFEQASRKALRFESIRGPVSLSVESLWSIPLESKSGLDLDTVAKTVKSKLNALSEESFVSTKANPEKEDLELSLEIVKHIISVRLKEREDKSQAVARAAERARLIEALDQKQSAAILQLSEDELKARIKDLS